MAPRREAGFGDLGPVFAERPDHVADDFRAAEELRQRADLMGDLGDFVIGGFDARDLVQHRLNAGLVAPRGDERQTQFAQIFTDEAPGVTRGAVNHDRFLGHDACPPCW